MEISSVQRKVIDQLYCEAVVLQDDVRELFLAFCQPGRKQSGSIRTFELSCEVLRATTLMMQAMRWVGEHRAYLKGELSEFKLRRQARLAHEVPLGDSALLDLMPDHVSRTIREIEQLYARLIRLDRCWHGPHANTPRQLLSVIESQQDLYQPLAPGRAIAEESDKGRNVAAANRPLSDFLT